jgi:hypothetical protein
LLLLALFTRLRLGGYAVVVVVSLREFHNKKSPRPKAGGRQLPD